MRLSEKSSSSRSRLPPSTKEKDAASKERKIKLEEELKGLRDDVKEKRKHWEKEKHLIMNISEIKEKIDHAKTEADELERKGDFGKVAEIRYGRISGLEQELKKKNEDLIALQKDNKMLKEEVDEEDIAQVVSKWTGIPVSKMLEGDMEKLVHMEERIHLRVIGQDRAHRGRGEYDTAGSGGASGPEPATRFISFSWPHRRGKDRARPGTGGVSLR